MPRTIAHTMNGNCGKGQGFSLKFLKVRPHTDGNYSPKEKIISNLHGSSKIQQDCQRDST